MVGLSLWDSFPGPDICVVHKPSGESYLLEGLCGLPLFVNATLDQVRGRYSQRQR
jgi:hypothetical protein